MLPIAMVRLTRPLIGDEEVQAVEAVLRSGMLVQGKNVARFEEVVARECDRAHAIAVSSGTSALHLALTALGVGDGDDVLCADMTWPSPAHAVRLCGANPILVDISPTEWNATPTGFADARTPNTRAAIVIDQFGFPSRHTEIAEALPNVPIVGDAACALGSRLDGRPAASFGDVSCISFHPRKVITTGEGGMCLTDDRQLADRLRELRNHGQLGPGQFVQAAGNHRLTEIAAVVGLAQMARLDGIVEARRSRAQRYLDALPGLGWQHPAPRAVPNYQTMGLTLDEGTPPEERDQIVSALRDRGIEAGILSYALHRLPSLVPADAKMRDVPNSASIVDRGISIPLYPTMTDQEQGLVIEALTSILPGRILTRQ